jgi:hypothetical protein
MLQLSVLPVLANENMLQSCLSSPTKFLHWQQIYVSVLDLVAVWLTVCFLPAYA